MILVVFQNPIFDPNKSLVGWMCQSSDNASYQTLGNKMNENKKTNGFVNRWRRHVGRLVFINASCTKMSPPGV